MATHRRCVAYGEGLGELARLGSVVFHPRGCCGGGEGLRRRRDAQP